MNQNAKPTAWVSAKTRRAKILLAVFFGWPLVLLAVYTIATLSPAVGQNVVWLLLAGALGLMAQQLL